VVLIMGLSVRRTGRILAGEAPLRVITGGVDLRATPRKGGVAMKTCLVVDDSSVIRKVARRILEGMQFEISEAEDGAQALDMCRVDLPDVVFLDLNMPKMDGMTFLKEMRNLPGGRRPKVVFCTTEHDVAHIANVLRAGADEYIVKPFDKEIVEAKFQQVGLL
jgi:two-component system, chemotaxis family, chemotaxis protein CheY